MDTFWETCFEKYVLTATHKLTPVLFYRTAEIKLHGTYNMPSQRKMHKHMHPSTALPRHDMGGGHKAGVQPGLGPNALQSIKNHTLCCPTQAKNCNFADNGSEKDDVLPWF